MIGISQMRYKRLFIAFTCFLFIAWLILLFRDLWRPKYYDTESMLHFISQPKDIKPKDFSSIIEQILPKPTLQKENTIATQLDIPQAKSQDQAKTPLTLHAIVNQNALINTTWLKLNESFTHDNEVYVLQKITKYGVYLKHKDNPKEVIYLEIFTLPQELFLQIR